MSENNFHSPWDISKIGNDYDEYMIFNSKNDVVINTVYGEQFANLVASAPDLLQACIGLCHQDLTGEQFASRLAFAQAVIAKATGES